MPLQRGLPGSGCAVTLAVIFVVGWRALHDRPVCVPHARDEVRIRHDDQAKVRHKMVSPTSAVLACGEHGQIMAASTMPWGPSTCSAMSLGSAISRSIQQRLLKKCVQISVSTLTVSGAGRLKVRGEAHGKLGTSAAAVVEKPT